MDAHPALVEYLPLSQGTSLSIRCGGVRFPHAEDRAWLTIMVDGRTGNVNRSMVATAHGIQVDRPDLEVGALTRRYLAQYNWERPSDSPILDHPCGLALANDFMNWMIAQLGGANMYWGLLMAAATHWFDTPEAFQQTLCRYFRNRFEAIGNLGATGNAGYETISTVYEDWRQELLKRVKAQR